MTDKTRLKLDGYRALLADHCELVDAVAALTARVAKLEAQHETHIDAMPITGAPSDSAFTIHADGTLERNAAPEAHLTRHRYIAEQHASGRTYAELAREFGLSSGRIQQMARRWQREVERSATPEARTATEGQTYTWLPGDAWSQYCEACP